MQKAQQSKTRKRGRPSKLPIPLTDAAISLGVSKSHLWRVISGSRTSASLSSRYAALVAHAK